MSVEGISEDFEITNLSPAFAPNSAEWNGKDVQTLSTVKEAWLVLKIPFNPQAAPPSLGEKVTSVNSKAIPTVEQVLERHNLTFAPTTLSKREVEQLPTSDHSWIIIPLLSSEAASLEGKVTIDANDHRNIQKVLERNGLGCRAECDPFFAMTNWV